MDHASLGWLIVLGIPSLANLDTCVHGEVYRIDFSRFGRNFDGIGAISGGGATSKLLVGYPDTQRNQILDFLFKPNYGASLHIFKVEIGGDSQSTDGTESSHMHEKWDENYRRGYEWSLMVEAKRRNPSIKLYGLPWAWPGWLGDSQEDSPYTNCTQTAEYIIKWVIGAKKLYGLTIDYLGIWNERPYSVEYVKVLRRALNGNGLSHVKLVVADNRQAVYNVTQDIKKDPEFSAAVSYIGTHYPGTVAIPEAANSGKTMWSSEDYSSFNDDVGAGCWARLLNQNYVNGNYTSTIAWNLIASYYKLLRPKLTRDGLMTAVEPWSGHFEINNPIWITAHTTQFTEIGWKYLAHGSGVGHLEKGGSYVTLVSPDNKDLTIVIETMSHEHSLCIRRNPPKYIVHPQNVTFKFDASWNLPKNLYIWKTHFGYGLTPTYVFDRLLNIPILDGTVSLFLDVDEVVTLTTKSAGFKGSLPSIPESKTFPLPFTDTYEAYPEYSEADYFAPQTGVWEVRKSNSSGHGMVNRQVITNKPVVWVDTGDKPLNIGGNYNWSDVTVTVDILVPPVNATHGVYVAVRVAMGGRDAGVTPGIFLTVHLNDQIFILTSDIEMFSILKRGALPVHIGENEWFNLGIQTKVNTTLHECPANDVTLIDCDIPNSPLIFQNNVAYGYLDGNILFRKEIPKIPVCGFVGYGTLSFGLADFDNFRIA